MLLVWFGSDPQPAGHLAHGPLLGKLLPGLSSWRSSWCCRRTRSHTTATPGAATLWAPGGSCCWADPTEEKIKEDEQ